jgi:hypothetical protein
VNEFFQKTEIQAVLLGALLAVIGWWFQQRHSSKRAKISEQLNEQAELSEKAKALLEEIKTDSRSSPKGITLFHVDGVGGFYEPFRWHPNSGLAVNSICRDIGDIRAAVEELVAARCLTPEEFHPTYETYRLI